MNHRIAARIYRRMSWLALGDETDRIKVLLQSQIEERESEKNNKQKF